VTCKFIVSLSFNPKIWKTIPGTCPKTVRRCNIVQMTYKFIVSLSFNPKILKI
jgi:hypothetical protein